MESLDGRIETFRKSRTPYVDVTVVRRVRPSSANVGDRAVVTEDGDMFGFVGGQCTRSLVVAQAKDCLRTGEPRLLLVTAHPPVEPEEGVIVLPMTCHSEGTVELFMEPRVARPLLAVIGESPIALALEQQAPTYGFDVLRSVLSNHEVEQDPVQSLQKPWVQRDVSPSYAVVATMGLYDTDAALALANLPLKYLGVVTSPRRWKILRQEWVETGLHESFVSKAKAPSGLDIGAVGPDEIALSILAELVQVRRQMKAEGHQLRRQSEGPDSAAEVAGCSVVTRPAPPSSRVLDPVCGMTVDLTRTTHTAVHDGRTFGFCCVGCKTKFLNHPDEYLHKNLSNCCNDPNRAQNAKEEVKDAHI